LTFFWDRARFRLFRFASAGYGLKNGSGSGALGGAAPLVDDGAVRDVQRTERRGVVRAGVLALGVEK